MPTKDPDYLLRRYRTSDFAKLFKLHVEAEISDRSGKCPSPAQLQERLQHPRLKPEEDLLVIEHGGEVAAFLEMTPEKEIQRLILDCLVHPLHRRKGMASMLLEPALERAAKMGAGVVHVNIARHNLAARGVLRRFGFSRVRTFLELRAEAKRIRPCGTGGGDSLFLRHLEPGEETLLARLQNRCFAGTWGFNPNTPQDIRNATSLKGCSMCDVIAAFEGTEPVAYCWAWAGAGGRKGRIHMLGVLPECRGKRIAGVVLEAGLSYLSRMGKDVIEITVDRGNPPACRLYFSAGFRVWSETLWFERAVPAEKNCLPRR